MPVSREDIIRTASLARLRLPDGEIDSLHSSLDKIFQYIDELHQVPTAGVAPLHHPLDFPLAAESDEPHACLNREEALRGAPDRTSDFFRIPRVLG